MTSNTCKQFTKQQTTERTTSDSTYDNELFFRLEQLRVCE